MWIKNSDKGEKDGDKRKRMMIVRKKDDKGKKKDDDGKNDEDRSKKHKTVDWFFTCDFKLFLFFSFFLLCTNAE